MTQQVDVQKAQELILRDPRNPGLKQTNIKNVPPDIRNMEGRGPQHQMFFQTPNGTSVGLSVLENGTVVADFQTGDEYPKNMKINPDHNNYGANSLDMRFLKKNSNDPDAIGQVAALINSKVRESLGYNRPGMNAAAQAIEETYDKQSLHWETGKQITGQTLNGIVQQQQADRMIDYLTKMSRKDLEEIILSDEKHRPDILRALLEGTDPNASLEERVNRLVNERDKMVLELKNPGLFLERLEVGRITTGQTAANESPGKPDDFDRLLHQERRAPSSGPHPSNIDLPHHTGMTPPKVSGAVGALAGVALAVAMTATSPEASAADYGNAIIDSNDFGAVARQAYEGHYGEAAETGIVTGTGALGGAVVGAMTGGPIGAAIGALVFGGFAEGMRGEKNFGFHQDTKEIAALLMPDSRTTDFDNFRNQIPDSSYIQDPTLRYLADIRDQMTDKLEEISTHPDQEQKIRAELSLMGGKFLNTAHAWLQNGGSIEQARESILLARKHEIAEIKSECGIPDTVAQTTPEGAQVDIPIETAVLNPETFAKLEKMNANSPDTLDALNELRTAVSHRDSLQQTIAASTNPAQDPTPLRGQPEHNSTPSSFKLG